MRVKTNGKWFKGVYETLKYVTVSANASQQATKRHATQLACTFMLHFGFSPKGFQGETSPQGSPQKGDMRRNSSCSSVPSSIS